MSNVKAAAVQISPVLYSRKGTVAKVIQKILELGRQCVRFVTFPETIIPYSFRLYNGPTRYPSARSINACCGKW
jgi:predicted amidohydrolase